MEEVKNLEELQSEGKVTVETHEDRQRAFKERQEREKQAKDFEKMIDARKSFLRKNIDILNLEVQYESLRNNYNEELLRKVDLADRLEAVKDKLDALHGNKPEVTEE